MSVTQKTKVKRKFNQAGVQINDEALALLDDTIARTIIRWVRNCNDGNVKRVTPETIHIALGNLSNYLGR